MKKAMISQPMAGLTEEEITETRNRAIKYLTSVGYEVVNTFFTDEWYSDKNMEERGVVNKPMCFFAKSVENMSKCDAVFFCKGWDRARGCRLEHLVAQSYGVNIIHEEADNGLMDPDIRIYARAYSPNRIRIGWEFDYQGKPYGDHIVLPFEEKVDAADYALLLIQAKDTLETLKSCP